MLWIKALHIVFVTAWFAGLFYMPRILVNLAMETDATSRTRLLTMARKLYRFMTMLAVFALAFGLWLWLGYFYAAAGGWLHAKLLLVALLIAYHVWCGKLLRDFAADRNAKSHVWFRWFNEVPVLFLFAIVMLVILQFGFGTRDDDLTRFTGGLMWVTLAFTAVLGVGRSYVAEREQRIREKEQSARNSTSYRSRFAAQVDLEQVA